MILFIEQTQIENQLLSCHIGNDQKFEADSECLCCFTKTFISNWDQHVTTYRTIKMVKVIERIATISKGLQENKNGTPQFFIEKSHQVARTRFELVSPP